MPLPAHFSTRYETRAGEIPPVVILEIGNLAFRLDPNEAKDLGLDLIHKSERSRGSDPDTGLSVRG